MTRRSVWTGVLAIAAAAFILALSFVATPVKFLAPDIPVSHLLGVGRVTFRASLACEVAILLPLAMLAKTNCRLIVSAAAVILALQWVALMPALDARTTAVMAGEPVGPSSLHGWWIAADLVRVGLYGALAKLAFTEG